MRAYGLSFHFFLRSISLIMLKANMRLRQLVSMGNCLLEGFTG